MAIIVQALAQGLRVALLVERTLLSGFPPARVNREAFVACGQCLAQRLDFSLQTGLSYLADARPSRTIRLLARSVDAVTRRAP